MKDNPDFSSNKTDIFKVTKKNSDTFLLNRSNFIYKSLGRKIKEKVELGKNQSKNLNRNENKSNFNLEILKTIIDDIQLGLCIVEKQLFVDPLSQQNKKALEVEYFNKAFLDLMQVNLNNNEETEELKSKDILKIFKEFVFLNEEENTSPLNNPCNFNNKSFNNANNNNNDDSKNKRNPRSISKERIKMDIEEKSGELSEKLNRSKETKDNFNNNSNSNNNNNSNYNKNTNNNNNFMNKSNNNFKNSNSFNNGSFGKKLSYGVNKNLNSSNSLKFVSRKSKMVRALDLYDVLVNYLINSKLKEKPGSNLNRKVKIKQNEEEENVLFKFKEYNYKDKHKSTNNLNMNNKPFLGSNYKSDLENDSDEEKINIKKFDISELNNYDKYNPNFSNDRNTKNEYYKVNKNKNTFKSTKFLPTKIREVKEFRFMRQNFFFSVRIQEIENYLVLIFENLDEEKKQIQNNLIKTIKNQYIITISHELNNPLNGLIHSIEELDFDEEERKKLVVKKIKRFKFMIKFFLKNIITNFKFFLKEPIQKNPSNINFGFILDSMKRSLFEFYEYKNITVLHDFSGLKNLVLQYDYFYFRYLLKNIFMYFYYKIPRNGKLVIEIEKENDIIELNNLIMGKDTSENDSDSSNQSKNSSCNLHYEISENKNKRGKSADKNSVRDFNNKNLNVSKNKSNRKNKNHKNNSKLYKKKITMIFKTEQHTVTAKKSSNNIFDKAYLENFDIENSIQTLEMLIESINKISKLLGIKIDFGNFNKKNSSILMNLSYYLDEEEESFTLNDINEYSEEYEKYKANCVFSINRTLINEEKKVYLNPTLNLKHFLSQGFNHNNKLNVDDAFGNVRRLKMLDSDLISGYQASTNANPYVGRTFTHLNQIRDISPIANRPDDDNDYNGNDYFKRAKTRNPYNNSNSSNFDFHKTNYLNYNNGNKNNAIYDSSNVDTNANAAEILSRNRSQGHTSNSIYLNSNQNEAQEANNIKNIEANDDKENHNYDSDITPLSLRVVNNKKLVSEENSNLSNNNNNINNIDNNNKNIRGYFLVKEKAKHQTKNKSFVYKEKHETSLFSKQFTNTKKPEQRSKFTSTYVSENIPKILVSQYEVEKERQNEQGREKEKFGTEIISMKRQNIYIEEAIENKSNANDESHSKHFIMESLQEETLNEAEQGNSLVNFSAHSLLERNIVREKAYSEHMVSLGSSGSNSVCFNNSMHNQKIFLNENANESQENEDVFNSFNNIDKSKNNLDDERFIDKILNLKENLRVKKLKRDLTINNKSFDDNKNKNKNNDNNNIGNIYNNDFGFLKRLKDKNLGERISNEKNNQIFFNTYNTYLNIDNVEKLNVISSTIKGKNETTSKDDFLKKYCNIKTDKNRFSLSDSNNLMTEKKNNNNNAKLININNNFSNSNNNFQAEHKLIKINEEAEFSTNPVSKNNDNNNGNSNKRNNLKHKLKEIEKQINPSIFNFTDAAAASAASEDSKKVNTIKASESNVIQSNPTPQNLMEASEEMNENYDTYDQNLSNTNNIGSIKLNNPTITKNPFGNSSQMLNINYIRSPRLFFHCRIPNLRSSKRRESALSGGSSNKSSKKKCECNDILLVDDELFNLNSMNFLLKKKKLKADTAMNGRECLQKIEEKLKKNCAECEQNEYKLIFMDIMMPEMDGIEASKGIQDMVKKGVLSQNVKILILTAHDTDVIRKRAREISVIKEFIGKPVKKSVVDDLLNKHYFAFTG